jgi:4-methyl-5(b-hydroxyethyl)-thiazole monophosphate biosynthesis
VRPLASQGLLLIPYFKVDRKERGHVPFFLASRTRSWNMKSVAVLLAPGFEEIEAITVIDVLRRADIQVTVAGIREGEITGSHEITVRPDKTLDEILPEAFDMVVLPGGLPGTDHLREDPRVLAFVQAMARAGKHTCAICAAPTVLEAAGVTAGRAVTSHPVVQEALKGLDYREERVVVDGTVVTSRGAGTAMEFALELVRILAGSERADLLAQMMLAK